VSLSTAFLDDVDPEWLLARNADLMHVHFEAFEESVSLACAFPLALLTDSVSSSSSRIQDLP